MKKTILTMLMVVAVMTVGFTGTAMATLVPTVDGFNNAGDGGAWAAGNLFTLAGDPNEADIPNQYDISSLSVIHANDGLATDGFYVMIDTFDIPSLLPGTNSDPGAEAFVTFTIDFNGDGVGDLFVNFNGGADAGAGLLGIYTSGAFTAASLVGYGTVAIGDVIEFYIPESVWEALGYTVDPNTGFRARYDNNGDEPDDSIPNSGFTNPIPEPATMGLVGMGLLSSLGLGLRRFRS